jgi:hypothetical protein
MFTGAVRHFDTQHCPARVVRRSKHGLVLALVHLRDIVATIPCTLAVNLFHSLINGEARESLFTSLNQFSSATVDLGQGLNTSLHSFFLLKILKLEKVILTETLNDVAADNVACAKEVHDGPVSKCGLSQDEIVFNPLEHVSASE